MCNHARIIICLFYDYGGIRMSYEIVNIFPHDLLLTNESSCISLYQSTHRHGPKNQQDLIRYKNLMQTIEKSLSEKFDKKTIKSRMKPFYEFQEDRAFWEHAGEGLAIFASENQCIVYRLQRPVEELAIVADSFHIKPLIRIFQSADRYHLLGLNRKEFALFEGTRYQIEQVELAPEVNRTMEEALGDDYEEKLVTTGGSGPRGQAMFHGFGSKKDVIDKVTEKFFRVVDKEVLDHYSRPMELPVYLVALDEHHTFFQKMSKNPHLQKEGVKVDYTSMGLTELREATWEVLEPIYVDKTRRLVDQFETARSKDEGSDDIAQVARAATESRISQVLIESDRIYSGRVDLDSGELKEANLDHPEIDDVLDDIAELVFKQRGEVVVLPKERMPSDTGVAAIYRY